MENKKHPRFALLPIIATFCVIMCMAGAAFYQLYWQRVNDENVVAAYVTRQAAHSVDSWLREQVAQASALANAPLMAFICTQPENEEMRNRVRAFFNAVQAKRPEYSAIALFSFVIPEEGVWITDASGERRLVHQGQVLADSIGDGLMGVPGDHFNYIQAIRHGAASYISEAKLSAAPGMPPVVMFGVPVHDDKGSPIGCLAVGIRLESLSDSFQAAVTLGRTGYVEIFDSNNAYIIHADKKQLLDPRQAPEMLLDSLRKGKTSFEINYKGTTLLYAATEVKPPYGMAARWWVLFRRDLHELYDTMLMPVGGVCVLLLLLFLLLAWLMYKIDNHARRTTTEKALQDELELHKGYQITLRQERSVLRSVLDNMQGMVFLRDKHDRYVTVNSQFTAIMGLTEAQVQDKTDTELLSPEMAVFCQETDAAALATRGPYYFEQSLPMPDGELRDYLFSKEAMYGPDGRFSGILSVGTDVTLLKETQRQLSEAKGKAEKANRAKSAFMSAVSHEVRTPMNAIQGFVHLFERSNLDDNQKEYLEKIRLASSNLLDIINNVLDISAIESGKLEIEQVSFRLSSLLYDLENRVSKEAEAKGLLFAMHASEEIPETLLGDPSRVHQLLFNLLDNALKFTDAGEVRLHVALEEDMQDIPAEQRDEPQDKGQNKHFIGFTIVDTGIGMTLDQIGHVFEPFMQGDISITRRHGGTGLGLSICQELVQLMGGSIEVRSELGEGSTFYVRLPFGKPSTAQKNEMECALQPDSIPTGMTGLLVEDNFINQEIAKTLLNDLGVAVDTADDGCIALEMIQKRSYDVIFMDMQMPNMDGLECTRRLRALGEDAESAEAPFAWLATVPIIAITANAMLEDKKRCLKAGMDDHLSKPVDPEALHATLVYWLKRRNWPSSVGEPSPAVRVRIM